MKLTSQQLYKLHQVLSLDLEMHQEKLSKYAKYHQNEMDYPLKGLLTDEEIGSVIDHYDNQINEITELLELIENEVETLEQE